MKTVVQYFLETYGFSIQHTSLPCLQVGNQQRPNYLPMEVVVSTSSIAIDVLCYVYLPIWFIIAISSFSMLLYVANGLKYQVCKIVEGQRYSKRLNEKQITALLKVTCQRPQEREKDILQVITDHISWFDSGICGGVAAAALALTVHLKNTSFLLFPNYYKRQLTECLDS